jgi:hypothetical protein
MASDTTPEPPKFNVQVSFDGTTATVIGFADPVLTLICDHAHPPGRPLLLRGHAGDNELSLEGKTIGSKLRPDDGRFTVTLRLTSLRRESRRAFESLFS